MLTNLGWMGFHWAIIDYNIDIATKLASTMQLHIGEDGSDALSFHVRDEIHVVMVDVLAVLFGLDVGADVAGASNKEDMNSFSLHLSPVKERKRVNIRNPAIQLFHQ